MPENLPSGKRKPKNKKKVENKRKEVGLFRAATQPLKNAFGWVVLTQVKSGLMTHTIMYSGSWLEFWGGCLTNNWVYGLLCNCSWI